jgi:hypothetical protein
MRGTRLIVGVVPDRVHKALVHTHGAVATARVANNVFTIRDAGTEPPDTLTLR